MFHSSATRLLGRGTTVLRDSLDRICVNMSSSSPGKSLRILVDMDGVLADFEGGFLKKYRARYPSEPYITLDDRRGFWVSAQYGSLRSDLSVSVCVCVKSMSDIHISTTIEVPHKSWSPRAFNFIITIA